MNGKFDKNKFIGGAKYSKSLIFWVKKLNLLKNYSDCPLISSSVKFVNSFWIQSLAGWVKLFIYMHAMY